MEGAPPGSLRGAGLSRLRYACGQAQSGAEGVEGDPTRLDRKVEGLHGVNGVNSAGSGDGPGSSRLNGLHGAHGAARGDSDPHDAGGVLIRPGYQPGGADGVLIPSHATWERFPPRLPRGLG